MQRKTCLTMLAFAGLLAGTSAYAAGAYDGTYRGPLTTTESMARTCHGAASVSRVVRDNTLTYLWANAQVSFPVAADGTISGQRSLGGRGKGQVTVHGQIDGDVLTLDSEGTGCGFHFVGHKIH